jgi:hypothetical protein
MRQYPTRLQIIGRKISDGAHMVHDLVEFGLFICAVIALPIIAIRAVEPALSIITTACFIAGFSVRAFKHGWFRGAGALAGIAIGIAGYALGPIDNIALPASELLTAQLVWAVGVSLWLIATAPCFAAIAKAVAPLLPAQ